MPDPGLVPVRGPDRSGFQDVRKGWIMSVKLTDAQLVVLSAAAQREDICLSAPDKMRGAILAKVSEKLVKLGLVREVRAKAGMPVWRRDETGRSYALKLTAAGLKAIAIDDGSEEAIVPREAPRQKPASHPHATNSQRPDIDEHAKTLAPRDGTLGTRIVSASRWSGPRETLRRLRCDNHIRRVLRSDLDRVRVCRAGDRESRTIARGKLAAIGRTDVDLHPLRRRD